LLASRKYCNLSLVKRRVCGGNYRHSVTKLPKMQLTILIALDAASTRIMRALAIVYNIVKDVGLIYNNKSL
jgi:hypothetical protein